MPEVAVLGLGPSGAFAVRAALDAGWVPHVFCRKSDVQPAPGAFWLHWIPGSVYALGTGSNIEIFGLGDEGTYRQKQWGKLAHLTSSSFPHRRITEKGYNPALVFPRLLEGNVCYHYLDNILTSTDIANIAASYSQVLQTFPAEEHMRQQPSRLPYFVLHRPALNPNANWVAYVGESETRICRKASLFGEYYLEFGKNVTLDMIEQECELYQWKQARLWDLHPSTQPVNPDMGNIRLIGRFAEWNRKRLSHEVYSSVYGLLSKN